MRLSVRLTTPSILGRKTSEMMATRMDPSMACGQAFARRRADAQRQARSTWHFLRQVNLDAVVIFHWKHESVHQETRDGAGLMEANGLDERREPAAVVSEIQKVVEVLEAKLGLKRFRLPGDEAVALQRVEHVLLIRGALHHGVQVKLGPADEPAQQLAV